MNSSVRIPAMLRGMDGIAAAILEVWQEQSSSGRIFTRCRIVESSSEMRDGTYTLEVFGRRILTKRLVWQVGPKFSAAGSCDGYEREQAMRSPHQNPARVAQRNCRVDRHSVGLPWYPGLVLCRLAP